MKIKTLTKLLTIADLAIDHQAAKNSEKSAKLAYHRAWRVFELDGDDPDDVESDAYRITRRETARWDAVIEATKAEYAHYQATKLATQKAARRLETAIRGFQP